MCSLVSLNNDGTLLLFVKMPLPCRRRMWQVALLVVQNIQPPSLTHSFSIPRPYSYPVAHCGAPRCLPLPYPSVFRVNVCDTQMVEDAVDVRAYYGELYFDV